VHIDGGDTLIPAIFTTFGRTYVTLTLLDRVVWCGILSSSNHRLLPKHHISLKSENLLWKAADCSENQPQTRSPAQCLRVVKVRVTPTGSTWAWHC